MRQSALFAKTKREAPAGEIARNAELLIRGGYVHKEMAGVYSILPLGLRVMRNIIAIIREEMNALGGQELSLSALQNKELWQASDRWSDKESDAWFKTTLKNDTEVGLGWTHEEPLTALMRDYINSYRDLPVLAYQFQTKFRNETRAKSGIMRGREFLMKDLYSFSIDKEAHEALYEKLKDTYLRIFDRVGIGHLTYLTFASGGAFAPYSHEFQTITGAGEDTIYIDEEKSIGVNKEVHTPEVLEQLGVSEASLVEHRAIEVGNIFTLGTRFSEALNLAYTDQEGAEHPVYMGSYGIGIERLMGTIVEVLSDDAGIIWPKAVAPFAVHVLQLSDDEAVATEAEVVYEHLTQAGIEVLFDDRTDASAGEKFADSDLLGMPIRVVVSKRSLDDGGVEYKERTAEKGEVISVEECGKRIQAHD